VSTFADVKLKNQVSCFETQNGIEQKSQQTSLNILVHATVH